MLNGLGSGITEILPLPYQEEDLQKIIEVQGSTSPFCLLILGFPHSFWQEVFVGVWKPKTSHISEGRSSYTWAYLWVDSLCGITARVFSQRPSPLLHCWTIYSEFLGWASKIKKGSYYMCIGGASFLLICWPYPLLPCWCILFAERMHLKLIAKSVVWRSLSSVKDWLSLDSLEAEFSLATRVRRELSLIPICWPYCYLLCWVSLLV